MAHRDAYRSTRRSAARSWRGGAVLGALVCVAAAHGHRAPGSLSTIEFNATTGNTEIVHRLHSHDAELGVSTVTEVNGLSVLDLEGRARIALYVEERFRIETDAGPLPLSLIGAELAGDYLLVYQEFTGRLPEAVRLRDDILRDAFPEQINQVNIDTDGVVRSVMFANDDGWRPFRSRSPVATD